MSKNGCLLKAINVKGGYILSNAFVCAVDGCTLKLDKGSIVGIAGESGSGKSSFAKFLMGYDKPPARIIDGQVIIDGIDIYKTRWNKRRKLWSSLISMIPQYSMNSLNPISKIKALVIDVMKESALKRIPEKEKLKKIEMRFEELGLTDVLDNYPFELSGGMKQRVVIAISTLLSPKVLIADEPTSALDVSSQRQLLNLLYTLVNSEIINSLIYISHDICTLRQICDNICIMYAGKQVEFAPTQSIIEHPLHPYTQLLLNAVPFLDPDIRNKGLIGIPGEPPDLINPPKGCRFQERCPSAKKRCRQVEPQLIEIEQNRYVACWSS